MPIAEAIAQAFKKSAENAKTMGSSIVKSAKEAKPREAAMIDSLVGKNEPAIDKLGQVDQYNEIIAKLRSPDSGMQREIELSLNKVLENPVNTADMNLLNTIREARSAFDLKDMTTLAATPRNSQIQTFNDVVSRFKEVDPVMHGQLTGAIQNYAKGNGSFNDVVMNMKGIMTNSSKNMALRNLEREAVDLVGETRLNEIKAKYSTPQQQLEEIHKVNMAAKTALSKVLNEEAASVIPAHIFRSAPTLAASLGSVAANNGMKLMYGALRGIYSHLDQSPSVVRSVNTLYLGIEKAYKAAPEKAANIRRYIESFNAQKLGLMPENNTPLARSIIADVETATQLGLTADDVKIANKIIVSQRNVARISGGYKKGDYTGNIEYRWKDIDPMYASETMTPQVAKDFLETRYGPGDWGYNFHHAKGTDEYMAKIRPNLYPNGKASLEINEEKWLENSGSIFMERKTTSRLRDFDENRLLPHEEIADYRKQITGYLGRGVAKNNINALKSVYAIDSALLLKNKSTSRAFYKGIEDLETSVMNIYSKSWIDRSQHPISAFVNDALTTGSRLYSGMLLSAFTNAKLPFLQLTQGIANDLFAFEKTPLTSFATVKASMDRMLGKHGDSIVANTNRYMRENNKNIVQGMVDVIDMPNDMGTAGQAFANGVDWLINIAMMPNMYADKLARAYTLAGSTTMFENSIKGYTKKLASGMEKQQALAELIKDLKLPYINNHFISENIVGNIARGNMKEASYQYAKAITEKTNFNYERVAYPEFINSIRAMGNKHGMPWMAASMSFASYPLMFAEHFFKPMAIEAAKGNFAPFARFMGAGAAMYLAAKSLEQEDNPEALQALGRYMVNKGTWFSPLGAIDLATRQAAGTAAPFLSLAGLLAKQPIYIMDNYINEKTGIVDPNSLDWDINRLMADANKQFGTMRFRTAAEFYEYIGEGFREIYRIE